MEPVLTRVKEEECELDEEEDQNLESWDMDNVSYSKPTFFAIGSI